MVFEDILAPLLRVEYGLRGVVLVDADGEMVAKAGFEFGAVDTAPLFGAHQGAILQQLAAVGLDTGGEVQELRICSESEEWFVFPVTTEYYLALAGSRGACIGRARASIRQCIRQLDREIDA